MSYSEEYICKQLLDNADVSIVFDPHGNKVELRFLVFGNVDGRYFLVTLHCSGIIVFRVNYQEPEESQEASTLVFLALECTVERKLLRETTWSDDFASTGNNSSADAIVSEVKVTGDIFLKIVCLWHTFEIQELSKAEYEGKFAEGKNS